MVDNNLDVLQWFTIFSDKKSRGTSTHTRKELIFKTENWQTNYINKLLENLKNVNFIHP